MNWSEIHNVYFIGIGGIGMSALARYFQANGKIVAGYDRTPSDLTSALENEGIHVHFTDDINKVDKIYFNKTHTLIVYTPAVPDTHKELVFFRKHEFTIMKRAQVLGLISANASCIAVAGTHGKTTTSSMTAHILKSSGINVTAFLGGIAVNYDSNYITSETTDYVVVEADEFDRSFLHLNPDTAVITSADADHLDIYGDEASIRDSFAAFAANVKPGGKIFIKKGLSLPLPDVSKSEYAAEPPADCTAENLRVENGRFEFDVVIGGKILDRFSLAMPGRHNVENAVAAISVAHHLEIPTEKIREAVFAFKGVKRRFEKIAEYPAISYIDDYAHHPTEIAACINGLRELYPGKKITGIFQPHLYSRTRDFAAGFAESLSMLDRLILLEIYPARELPIDGVSSAMILENVTLAGKAILSKEKLMETIAAEISATDVLLTIGAGDIDRLVTPIGEMIEKMNANRE